MITEVDLFAVGCPGQNKNSILPTMMQAFIEKARSVQTITLHFFEVRHGQSEGDA